MKEARAQYKFIRISSRKVNVVMECIRGKNVEQSFQILKFINKSGARIVENLLKSAVDNAVKTKKADMDRLYIDKAYADAGPTMKRFMPRAQGRAAMIRKRFSHATIIVKESDKKIKAQINKEIEAPENTELKAQNEDKKVKRLKGSKVQKASS